MTGVQTFALPICLKDRVTGHVLDDFSKAELEWVAPLLVAIAEAAPRLAVGDGPGFTNRLAMILTPEESEPPAQGPG